MNASIIGQSTPSPEPVEAEVPASEPVPLPASKPDPGIEIGGRDGPEPTRYGDWEKNGRCIDF